MKKWILITVGLLLVFTWAVFYFIPLKVLTMITEYEPYTFERILPYDSMRVHYGIDDHDDPTDYGYESVEEVAFTSGYDGKRLSGWYVNSAPGSHQCVLLIHGRTSNRLKTMKYLELFRKTGLDTVYNFFIPDLRNSGKSEPASTYMGYRFADDIAAALAWTKRNHQQDTIVLYGFSMGAMAIETLLARPDLVDEVQAVYIDKIILDSPLSDVKGTLWRSAREMGLPEGLFDYYFGLFSEEIDGFGENMRFGFLLSQNNIPTLILASEDDPLTPFDLLTEELSKVRHLAHIQMHSFPGLPHVKLYQTDSTKGRYTQLVHQFLSQ